ncbi:hypothetical protein TNCV_1850321 [Trichonephila clavipes]|nr:hypothetical protein TNCV_1850321 [Trichonephila clavipes]
MSPYGPLYMRPYLKATLLRTVHLTESEARTSDNSLQINVYGTRNLANLSLDTDDGHNIIICNLVKVASWKLRPNSQFFEEYVRKTATAGSDVVQSGRPIFDDFFQHLWPYIGNNTANVVFQMVKRLWLIRIDQ